MEEAQLRAEAQVDEFTALAAQMRNELDALQARVAAKEAELAAAELRGTMLSNGRPKPTLCYRTSRWSDRTQLPVR